MDRDRMWWGLVLIAVGGVFLADRLGAIDAWPVIRGWWPAVVVLAGLLRLLDRPPDLRGAGALVVIGLLLLAWRQGLLPPDLWGLIVPGALVLIGLWLLIRRDPRSRDTVVASAHENLDVKVLLGARELRVTGERFTGGQVGVTLGGIELDLRDAVLPAEGAELRLSATLGGIEVTLPTGWDVRVEASGTLGGTDDRTAPAAPGAPVLRVRTECVLGGVELRSDPRTVARPVNPWGPAAG